ncbi:hypothetical protein Lser_V15G18054 [Lactuca serriola]
MVAGVFNCLYEEESWLKNRGFYCVINWPFGSFSLGKEEV